MMMILLKSRNLQTLLLMTIHDESDNLVNIENETDEQIPGVDEEISGVDNDQEEPDDEEANQDQQPTPLR